MRYNPSFIMLWSNNHQIKLALPVNDISGNQNQECILDGKESLIILESWNNLNMNWLGVYYTPPHPHSPQTQSLSDILGDLLRERPGIQDRLQNLWHLIIGLDTRGRLEIRAFFQQTEGLFELPVAMLEDHQAISS